MVLTDITRVMIMEELVEMEVVERDQDIQVLLPQRVVQTKAAVGAEEITVLLVVLTPKLVVLV